MPKESGFTLIELLITISIIAILVTVGIISYIAFLRTTRDTARQADLKTIQSVLEQYHSDQHFYPPAQFTIIGQKFTNPDGTKVYLNSTPKEQWHTSPYLYVPLPTGCGSLPPLLCSDYCLYAKLEGVSLGLGNCPAYSDYNYAISQP